MKQKLLVKFKNNLINACIHLSFSYNLGSLRLYRSCAAVDHLYITADIIKPKMKNTQLRIIIERKKILNKIEHQ